LKRIEIELRTHKKEHRCSNKKEHTRSRPLQIVPFLFPLGSKMLESILHIQNNGKHMMLAQAEKEMFRYQIRSGTMFSRVNTG
jgi:hypothetical protein